MADSKRKVLNLATRPADITPAEAASIGKEACTFGFPMVDNSRIQHATS